MEYLRRNEFSGGILTATADQTPPVATISGRDLLEKLDGMTALLTSVLIKIDPLPASLKDHEERIRKLEYRQWFTAGVASVGGAGLTALIEFLISRH